MIILEYIMITCNLVVLVIVLFGKGFIGQYSRNQADKMFKKVLTDIEETSRQVFRTELANHNLTNQHKFSIATERRNAIFFYTDALYELHQDIYQDVMLETNVNPLNRTYLKYNQAAERLKLFYSDQTFTDAELRIREGLNELRTISYKRYIDMQNLYRLRESWQSEPIADPSYWESITNKFELEAQKINIACIKDFSPRGKDFDADLSNIRRLLSEYILEVFKKP